VQIDADAGDPDAAPADAPRGDAAAAPARDDPAPTCPRFVPLQNECSEAQASALRARLRPRLIGIDDVTVRAVAGDVVAARDRVLRQYGRYYDLHTLRVLPRPDAPAPDAFAWQVPTPGNPADAPGSPPPCAAPGADTPEAALHALTAELIRTREQLFESECTADGRVPEPDAARELARLDGLIARARAHLPDDAALPWSSAVQPNDPPVGDPLDAHTTDPDAGAVQ
jgi:hypothetical protein